MNSINLSKSQITHWLKLISVTGSAQILVQGLAFVSGIVILRILPTKEYALYTIANAMLGTLSVLSDSGISTGVMAQGGIVWKDKIKLGEVLTTGMYLRKKFSICSLIISLPILVYLLRNQEATWLSTILICISIIPPFYAALSDNLLETVLKLHQAIVPLQKNQVSTALLRLILVTSTVFFFPFTFIALFSNGLPRIWGNYKLRKINTSYLTLSSVPNRVISDEILKIVKRGLPEVLFFCFSGQITIYFLSIFGVSNSIASVGALSRLGMIMTVFYALANTLFVPRFSRLAFKREILLKGFLKIIFSFSILCLLIQLVTFLFSRYILFILGPKFFHLNSELNIFILGANFNLIVGICFGLYSSKGWIIKPTISLPINCLILIVGMLTFKLSTLSGVLWFNVFNALMQLIFQLTFAIVKIVRIND